MSLTIPVQTSWTLTWTLTDQNNNPINNANVVATLYSGRSAQNPNAVPGTPVPPLVGVVLSYILASAGQYSAAIPATFNPTPDGSGFTLVIDGDISGTQIYHHEEPAVLETAGSVLDLTTVDQVKAWIPQLQGSNSDDTIIQSCITAWGYAFLSRTGLGDQNGDIQQSPFTAICDFNETYDGMGTTRLFLKNRPIRSVSLLSINGISIAQSGSFGSSGYVIDGTGKSIAIRSGIPGAGGPSIVPYYYGGSYHVGGGLRFWYGIQNVNVQYSAGYNNTPADIVEAANIVVQQNYKRRSWQDEASRAMAGGGGTIRYRDWLIDPRVQEVCDRYSRTL